MWAKRGVLLGSFFGATLVTALLAIVPLYEASVKAIDLLFTVRNARADDVQVSAFFTDNSFTAGVAEFNRDLVEEAHPFVAPWYPDIDERAQSREFVVIPIDGSVLWLDQAEAWRAEIAALTEQDANPDLFPPPPYPTPPREATTARIMTAPDIQDRVQVIEGHWPDVLEQPPEAGDGDPLPIVLGGTLASVTQQSVGDQFVLKLFSGLPHVFELVEVVAVVEAVDRDQAFWGIDRPSQMIYLPQGTFEAWLGELFINQDDDPWSRSMRGLPNTNVTQRWFLDFDRDSLELEGIDEVRSGIAQFRARLARDGGVAANTFLPQILNAFDVRSVVIGGPILAILALVVGGALYFLVYTAALTLEREGPELALLRTRGASAWQTVGIHLAQSLLIAAVAAVVAPYVARSMVALTGRVPPLSELTGNEPLRVAQERSIVPFLIGGGALTFIAMGLAILPFARRSVLELRSLAARPTTKSVWQRYNLDLFAIGISLVILLQLAQRGFINLSGDEAELDPLAVVFPALLLFTGALVLLRLLPWLLRLIGWLMTKLRGLSSALPGWHLGRNPVPYGRLALLVWLTTGLGAFALTYAFTLESSFDDRAAFEAGADVRIVANRAGWLETSEGEVGAAVYRTSGAPRQTSRQAEVLAVRPGDFSAVVSWRSDFGGSNASDVFSRLRPDGTAPDLGIELPADTTGVRIDGVVVPRTLALKAELGDEEPDTGHRLLMKVFDGRGRVWTLAADQDFDDTGWKSALVTFDDDGALTTGLTFPIVPPISIHTIWFERSAGGNRVIGGSVLLNDFVAVTPAGEVALGDGFEDMDTVNGMNLRLDTAGDFATQQLYRELPEGQSAPSAAVIAASPLTKEDTVTRLGLPGARTRINPLVPALRRIPDPMNVLLDREAASIAGVEVGDESVYGLAAQIVQGRLVGFVEAVPTMTDRTRFGLMLIDLDAFNAWVNGPAAWSFETALPRIEAPGELWVRTDNPDAAVRRLLPQLPDEPDFLFTINESASDFSSRPVQVGLVAILFVGAATGVVLALAGVTGYVLLAVSRRAREMGVLRALGFQRKGVAATFAVEQLVVRR